MSGGSFLLKAFNEDIGGPFSINAIIAENRIDDDEVESKLLSKFEVKIYLVLPFIHDSAFLSITKSIYKELKKGDPFDILEMSTTYDDYDKYNEYALVFDAHPTWIKKILMKQGFIARENLHVNFTRQESLSEYSTDFFNLDYVEEFINSFKPFLKDPSNEPVSNKVFS